MWNHIPRFSLIGVVRSSSRSVQHPLWFRSHLTAAACRLLSERINTSCQIWKSKIGESKITSAVARVGEKNWNVALRQRSAALFALWPKPKLQDVDDYTSQYKSQLSALMQRRAVTGWIIISLGQCSWSLPVVHMVERGIVGFVTCLFQCLAGCSCALRSKPPVMSWAGLHRYVCLVSSISAGQSPLILNTAHKLSTVGIIHRTALKNGAASWCQSPLLTESVAVL